MIITPAFFTLSIALGMATLSPMRGTIGGSGGAGFLRGFAMTPPA
jgi:hypothetical protein